MHDTGAAAGSNASAAPSRGAILVVDDDHDARRVVVSILSDAGYAVRAVATAHEARHGLAQDDGVAVLISEVSMPAETGLDLLQFATSEHPMTATLLMSAREDPAIAQAAIAFGACGYLSKPVSRSALLVAVQAALRRRDEQAARASLMSTVDLRTLALSRATDRIDETTRQSRELQSETIHRWAQAAEFREPGIAGHLERMSRCCGLLGDRLGLHGESMELASVLHDIGKVAIPDRILLKRDPLTRDERLAIETHAEVGYEMLVGSGSNMLDLAAVIARTHHEKFDGSGYPHGLAGTDIPLEGRIAAVADVFDALTNNRVYRRAWSVQSAVAWMTHQRGTHFDPSVLETLTSSIEEILAHHAPACSS